MNYAEKIEEYFFVKQASQILKGKKINVIGLPFGEYCILPSNSEQKRIQRQYSQTYKKAKFMPGKNSVWEFKKTRKK